MGAVHHLLKFLPDLARKSNVFRSLLKNGAKFKWDLEHHCAFNEIKHDIANFTENAHYNPNLPTRVRCDASIEGLGAALEQQTSLGWKPIAFASRFLNNCESKYSVNELEFLGVVWSIEHFKHYLHGKGFVVVTDHRAFLSILKDNRGNKTYQSRLTRWLDRLLPFDFELEHLAGKDMGFVDYMSRNPIGAAVKVSSYDNEFIVAQIQSIADCIYSASTKQMDLQRKCTSCNLIGRKSTHESSSLKTNDSLSVNLHAPVQSNNEYLNFPCRSVLCLPNQITSLLTEMSSED